MAPTRCKVLKSRRKRPYASTIARQKTRRALRRFKLLLREVV